MQDNQKIIGGGVMSQKDAAAVAPSQDVLDIPEQAFREVLEFFDEIFDGKDPQPLVGAILEWFQPFGRGVTNIFEAMLGDRFQISSEPWPSDAELLEFFADEVLREKEEIIHDLVQQHDDDKREVARKGLSNEERQQAVKRAENSWKKLRDASMPKERPLRCAFSLEIKKKNYERLREAYFDLRFCTDFGTLRRKYPKVSKRYLELRAEKNQKGIMAGLECFLYSVTQDQERRKSISAHLCAIFLMASSQYADSEKRDLVPAHIKKARGKKT